MERIVRHITQQLVDRLPKRKDFFTPDELRELEIPEFIVERIEVEMERNLDDSVVPPYTEWADMNNETVLEAWEQFINAILAEARMPKIYAQSVFETAVADTVEILMQPRRNIKDAIFGPDKALDLKTIEKRIKAVTVYKHLSSAVLRYMNRRNLQALTYEQCENIINKVDEKLVANYNPLNWAQLLSPLFQLLGNNVDTDLLRLFFEDKGRKRIARKFDLLNSSVSKTQVIEILSAPDLLDLEGYEDPQNKLFAGDSASEKDKNLPGIENLRKHLFPDGPELNIELGDIKFESPAKEKSKEERESDDAILSTFHKRRSYYSPEEMEGDEEELSGLNQPEAKEDKVNTEKEIPETVINKTDSEERDEPISEEDEPVSEEKKKADEDYLKNDFEIEEKPEADEDKPLHKLFLLDEEVVEKEEFSDASDEDESLDDQESLNSIFVTEEHDIEEISDEAEKRFDEPEIVEEHSGEDDHPMWKRFLSVEDDSEIKEPDEKEKSDDTNFKTKNTSGAQILNLTSIYDEEVEENDEDDIQKLHDWLSSERKRFIRVIFNDSEKTFISAMEEISAYDDWKGASKYIEKNIFSRNMIDMYSDEAVDFTDRLHSFFKEYKSSQTTKNG